MFKKIVLGAVLVWAGTFVVLAYGIGYVDCNNMYDDVTALQLSFAADAAALRGMSVEEYMKIVPLVKLPPNECVWTTLENLPSRIKYNMGIS